MPADHLTRETVARAIFEKRWPGHWNNHAFLHQQDQAYDEADAVLQALSEPARLSPPPAESSTTRLGHTDLMVSPEAIEEVLATEPSVPVTED